jgi:hypothetical protein
MTTYTWNAQTQSAAWTDPVWDGDGPLPEPYPQPGDEGLIQYGTVDLTVPVVDVEIVLQALPTFGVRNIIVAATDAELGGGTTLTTGAETLLQPIVYDVIATGTVDGGATVQFSQAPLTIDLTGLTAAAPPVFVNDGRLAGGALILQNGTGTTTSTVVNNNEIAVSAGLTVQAGVTLSGIGTIDIDGMSGAASIAGAVGAGQTLVFTNPPPANELGGALTIGDIAHFHGTVDLDANHEIVVAGVTPFATVGDVVTFSNGSTLEVIPSGDAGTIVTQAVGNTTLIDGVGPVDVFACFCTGTRIATTEGEVAVEHIRPGDMARLADGSAARVIWVGQREVRCDRHPRPQDVWPVRIRAGAFAPGEPRRDLLLSPDHAVFLAGNLIPIRHLTNGASIAQEAVESVRYHHVELARHDLLLAEGLAAESYLDTGNRNAFTGCGPATALHPAFARRVWLEEACLPLVEQGPAVARARAALLQRAEALGHRRTGDPGLRVLADGRPVRAAPATGGRVVDLPPRAVAVRLLSRTWTPAEMRPGADDRRRLGIGIGKLWLDRREVSLDSPALSSGWHDAERDGRWTDGEATLAVAGARTLAFTLAMAGEYWADQIGSRNPQRSASARHSRQLSTEPVVDSARSEAAAAAQPRASDSRTPQPSCSPSMKPAAKASPAPLAAAMASAGT